ncbi:hypothetical protein FLAVO9AF_10240 [Flavobacterium sp. 9AF]|nr:hypothetical protein FLAVO9AF_10240 [Flavobacterium sp. 9AF]
MESFNKIVYVYHCNLLKLVLVFTKVNKEKEMTKFNQVTIVNIRILGYTNYLN